jgi:prevent-host-death family protein
MTTEALRSVRNHFSDVVDRVERQHERVIVTRNGKPAVVITSSEDLAELEERGSSSLTRLQLVFRLQTAVSLECRYISRWVSRRYSTRPRSPGRTKAAFTMP